MSIIVPNFAVFLATLVQYWTDAVKCVESEKIEKIVKYVQVILVTIIKYDSNNDRQIQGSSAIIY